NLDQLECQDTTSSLNITLLNHPEVRSDLCSVGDYTIRHCRHFVEEVNFVPIVMFNNHIYPLRALQTRQEPQLGLLTSYRCQGDCVRVNCETADCVGDDVFCRHFDCNPTTQPNCNCTYNPTSDIYKIQTAQGEIMPRCWGHLYLLTRKEDRSLTHNVFDCDGCEIECTTHGVQIKTNGKVPKYIKVLKNPEFISTIPTSVVTDITFTRNMLAATGVTHVEIWFANFDVPSIKNINCPRLPICDLISCYLYYILVSLLARKTLSQNVSSKKEQEKLPTHQHIQQRHHRGHCTPRRSQPLSSNGRNNK
ncbi:unnamed protein product, partial [Allacma fusca]